MTFKEKNFLKLLEKYKLNEDSVLTDHLINKLFTEYLSENIDNITELCIDIIIKLNDGYSINKKNSKTLLEKKY